MICGRLVRILGGAGMIADPAARERILNSTRDFLPDAF
jgi:hypothetical protein